MYRVIVSPFAKQDIADSAAWYNSKQKGLGKRFTSEVRQKVKILAANPLIFSVRYNSIRTVVFDIFPFMAHYTIDDIQKQVIILAVFHTSLNPAIWKSRIR